MKLFLLRHAEAGERDRKKYPNDALRPLTTEGKRKTLRAAKWMRRHKITFDRIITSPYLRALQTAEIVAGTYKMKVQLNDFLAPEGSVRDLIKLLQRAKRDAVILLVGHEPEMSQMIALLLSGKKGLDINLKKGGLCRLSIDSPRYGRCARLGWLLTADHLQA